MVQPNFKSSRIMDTSNLGKGNNATVQKTDESGTKEEPFRIAIEEHMDFPNLLRGGLLTTFELMQYISEILTPAYKDYAGCHVIPISGKFDIRLFFKTPSVDNKAATSAFTLADNRPGNNLIDRVSHLGNRGSNRTYEITKHGKQGLAEFFYAEEKNINWNMVISEEADRQVTLPVNVAPQVYAVVSGLDINSIMRKIYGNKIDGEDVQYSVTPHKIIGIGQQNSATPNAMQNWLLSVQAIALKELDKAQRAVGIYYESGSIPMIGRAGQYK